MYVEKSYCQDNNEKIKKFDQMVDKIEHSDEGGE